MNSEPKSQIPDDFSKIKAWCHHAGSYSKNGSYLDLSIDPEELRNAATLFLGKGYFLEDITGVDVAEGILLIYHFDRYDVSGRVTLRLISPHDSKVVPSIALIHSGADWHERECFDFFGVVFEGHPNLKPLLLPDDLGYHPLLKEKGRKPLMSLLPLDQVVEGSM